MDSTTEQQQEAAEKAVPEPPKLTLTRQVKLMIIRIGD